MRVCIIAVIIRGADCLLTQVHFWRIWAVAILELFSISWNVKRSASLSIYCPSRSICCNQGIMIVASGDVSTPNNIVTADCSVRNMIARACMSHGLRGRRSSIYRGCWQLKPSHRATYEVLGVKSRSNPRNARSKGVKNKSKQRRN